MVAPETRSVSADAIGNVFTTAVDGSAVVIERLLPGATSFVDRRSLSAMGDMPSVAAIPGTAAALVVFTEGTSVRATVQAFP